MSSEGFRLDNTQPRLIGDDTMLLHSDYHLVLVDIVLDDCGTEADPVRLEGFIVTMFYTDL